MNEQLSPRKQKILKAVVDEYILNATPISSGEIKSKYFDDISSATIRTELSSLEELGYLIQPHVSSGRIPSTKAYALYVDKFIQKKSLTKNEIDLIETTFSKRFNAIEEVLKSTAKIISDITNYTSVIVLKDINEVIIKNIKLVELDQNTALVILVTDSGIIRDKIITLPQHDNLMYINDANALLNKIFSGKRIREVIDGEELIKNEINEFRELFENIIAILTTYSNKNDDIYFDGQSKFLETSSQDLNVTKNFLEIFDSKEKLKEMVDNSEGMEFTVKIGKDETGGIDKCAIVTAKYSYKGKEIGCAGVIGPERMNYGKVISVLEYITRTLNAPEGDKQ